MKIAICYDLHYPSTFGGAEKRFLQFGEELGRRGHSVTYICAKFWEGPAQFKQGNVTVIGVVSPGPLRESKHTLSAALRYSFASALTVIRNRFDVVDCCNFPYIPALFIVVIQHFKRRAVCTTWLEYTGSFWNQVRPAIIGKIGSVLERCLLWICPDAVAISNFTARRLIEAGLDKEKIEVVTAGIDRSEIENASPNGDSVDLIYVGRLEPHKRVMMGIEAVSQIQKELERPVKILIIGAGSEKEALLNRASQLNIQAEFLSGVSDKDVFSYLKSARVFILPSEREGLGIAALEALSCGVPIVTTNSPHNAVQYLIQDRETGRVCEDKEFASGILDVLRTDPREWNERCKKAAEAFTFEAETDRLEQFYKKLIK